MGLLDIIENAAAGNANQGAENTPGASANAGVMGGLLQALDQHPGGLSGVLDSFRNNGLGDHVQNWANGASGTGGVPGNQPASTPGQIEQGLSGTGLIEKVAAKAGVSPEVAKVAMATVLPLVVAHMTSSGQQPPQGGYGGMASQILSRLR